MKVKLDELWKQSNGNYKCPHCDKEYTRNGICTHIWRKHLEDGKKHNPLKDYHYKNGKGAWNKGLTKDDPRIQKGIDTLKKRYASGELVPHMLGKKLSKETIEKLKKNTGGARPGSGRGKSGWYNKYWCDSTWELAWLIYTLDSGKNPIRNSEGFPYTYNDKDSLYYPDFIIDGVYYEIKGYMRERDYYKHKAFPHKLIVLDKHSMKDILKYVYDKHNTKYLYTLYDSYNKEEHEYNNRICEICNVEFYSKYKKKCCSMECSHKLGKITFESNPKNTYHGNRPNKDELLLDISKLTLLDVGKKYGVSDNSIRKWLKSYELPYKKIDIKNYLSNMGIDYVVKVKHTIRGELSTNSKVTESDVREIRRLFSLGNITKAKLSRDFGIAETTLSHIINNDTWKHVK
jgi:hypothetical protein